MRPTWILRNYACRITLFTRANCSLCSDAKQVLSKVWDKRPFEYTEIDVMQSKEEKWKHLYEFDTPVVHFDKTEENNTHFETSENARKLMHRFKEEEVQKAMDEAMQTPPS
ncbi:hypothetical protein LTR66_001352 [Elasticomyces elasticus]|nr:hypothetical protein LTR50_000177 [Elasticomyces elasticus]KAK4999667.1 hypothetical protein LTR66_001352 [Elasticomyces elasticus]KAK5007905.1 hypothetical protein LTR28_004684 [Elasticomyces elasticus]